MHPGLPVKRPSFPELCRTALRQYGDNFQRLLGIAFIAKIAIPFAVGIFLVSFVIKDPTTTSTSEPNLPLSLFSLFLGSILSLLAQIAIFPLLAKQLNNVRESLQHALQNYAPALWTGFLYCFFTVGLTGYFVVPGILFAIRSSLAFPIVALTDQWGMKALLNSRTLTRQHTGWLAGQLVLLTAVQASIGLLAGQLPTFFSLAAELLILPFTACFVYLLYQKITSWEADAAASFPSTGESPPVPALLLQCLLGYAIGLSLLGFLLLR